VPQRTIWDGINESEENRQRYDEARKNQDDIIKVKIDEVMDAMRGRI